MSQGRISDTDYPIVGDLLVRTETIPNGRGAALARSSISHGSSRVQYYRVRQQSVLGSERMN
jgi:hypothetical protein